MQKQTTLILVDTTANSNKFYRLELDSNGTVTKTYGRVGNDGVTATELSGEYGYRKILDAKVRKGYRAVDVASTPTVAAARLDNSRLHTIAKSGLASGKAAENAVVQNLIDRIVRVNAHDILESSGGLIKVDISGRIQTPLGLVTSGSIFQAGRLLSEIETSTGSARTRSLERYLTLVPQKVAARAGWAETFFDPPNSFSKQRDLLQQLTDSLSFFDAQAATAAVSDDGAADAGFKYKLRAVSDTGATFKRIQAKFESTKNDMHASASLKVKRVFEMVDPAGAKEYASVAAEVGNEQQLWHGTKAANLLSILRKGLYVPPTRGSTVQIAGRMFGDGVYLSSQSSKSANYSAGYWTTGSRETNCFMLLADVAMGSEFRPVSSHDAARRARTEMNKFGKPYNSINVKPGTAGVRNHEAIVWNLPQVRVRYLVELDR